MVKEERGLVVLEATAIRVGAAAGGKRARGGGQGADRAAAAGGGLQRADRRARPTSSPTPTSACSSRAICGTSRCKGGIGVAYVGVTAPPPAFTVRYDPGRRVAGDRRSRRRSRRSAPCQVTLKDGIVAHRRPGARGPTRSRSPSAAERRRSGSAVPRRHRAGRRERRRAAMRNTKKNAISTSKPTATTSATTGNFSASAPSPTTKTSSNRLSDPVRERLGRGVGGDARRRLGHVRDRGHAAAEQRRRGLRAGRRLAERRHRDERAAERTNHRVHGVPDRVDPGHLVGDELDHVAARGRCRSPSCCRRRRTAAAG